MADTEDKEKEAEEKSMPSKTEEILHILKKGAEFTHELLKENEKLRYKVASLEEENSSFKKGAGAAEAGGEMDKLRKTLHLLEEEKAKLIERFKAVEEENKDFANRYIEIENENNILANLYVASYQLHSTLDFNEVIRIILEIIINLIGAEKFAIFLLDEKTHELTAVATEGLEREGVPTVFLGEGIIGSSAKGGGEYFAKNLAWSGSLDEPIVCVPMKIKERVIGAIVIFKLLQQKNEFSKLDYEMFTLLAGHTATAIFSAKLYSESERKLSTIQGFISLLTK